jgi:hypothetical protein
VTTRQTTASHHNACHQQLEIAVTYGWPINKWDVSIVQDFFSYLSIGLSDFKEDIALWDTSQATTMEEMFRGAHAFNQKHFQLGRVQRDGYGMDVFPCHTAFNGDISNWNVSNVTNICLPCFFMMPLHSTTEHFQLERVQRNGYAQYV